MTDLMEAPTEEKTVPGLVWQVVNPIPQPTDEWRLEHRKSWTAATSVSVWRNEERDSVSCTWSEQIMGINAYSGKTYSRWQKTQLINIRRNHKGNIVIIGWEKNLRKRKRWFTVYESFQAANTITPMIDEMEKHFGVRSIKDIFPLASPGNLYTVAVMPKGWMPLYRGQWIKGQFTTDVQKLTKKLYGKENYRKDLVKSVASSHSGWHFLMYRFLGLVPIDWIVAALKDRQGTTPNWMGGELAGLPGLLRLLDRNSLRRLLNADDTNYVPDCIRMFDHSNRDYRRQYAPLTAEELAPFRITDWRSLHQTLIDIRNQVSAEVREQQRKQALERKAKNSKFAQTLDCMQVNGQVLLLAENGAELMDWSNEFNNCISGYQNSLEEGSTILAAIFDTNREDKMIVNLEIRDGRLIQFLGKGNSRLPDEVKSPWLEALKAKGVEIPEGGWGW